MQIIIIIIIIIIIMITIIIIITITDASKQIPKETLAKRSCPGQRF